MIDIGADLQRAFDEGYRKGKEDEHRWWSKLCANCDGVVDEPQESKIIEAYAKGFKDGADAVKAMPQTEEEIARAVVHKMIDDSIIAEDVYPDLRQRLHDAVDGYESQTESNTRWRHKGDCLNCAHWEHGAHSHYYCELLEMRQECCFESRDESTLMFARVPQTEREGE